MITKLERTQIKVLTRITTHWTPPLPQKEKKKKIEKTRINAKRKLQQSKTEQKYLILSFMIIHAKLITL